QIAAKKTVAQMLQRDTFKKRLAADIDVYTHEFLYPLMQGYDSVMVKSDVELGGTDQTFNNLVGRDIQKAYGQPPQVVITMPILVGLDGAEKMSKSKGNYIGVTDEPNDMFGKVMSISDEMMENYFTLLTAEPADKIAELIDPAKTHPKEAKVLLAKAIVAQFWDKPPSDAQPVEVSDTLSISDAAAAHFDKVFAKKQLPNEIPIYQAGPGIVTVKQFLVSSGLVETGSEAKRLVAQGAVTIAGQRVQDPNAVITPENDGAVVKVGPRRFAQIQIIRGEPKIGW
ncbi:MAG TPA: tyrosine--tRNA ligase, partial [Sedimentisphaerales bacterium]|nr:tyrosine--tRNA ligase [Sedimentisphaerales bacterium]